MACTTGATIMPPHPMPHNILRIIVTLAVPAFSPTGQPSSTKDKAANAFLK
jgi:hypothetical protein